MAPGESPTARAVAEARAIHGTEVLVEAPQGERIPFLSYASPLTGADGAVRGAVNILIDVSDRELADEGLQRLAAIVASSDDAIISKDLNGIILSWNASAERIFGYSAAEAIGAPVTILIPEDRRDEEPFILEKIRSGRRVEHYETVRRCKEGRMINVSLTVSPIKDSRGQIIGASNISRDITDRRRAQEHQQLLMREMNHRIKNLFALASSVVTLSARQSQTPAEMAASVRERLGALSRAHALTVTSGAIDGGRDNPATLHELVAAIVEPYAGEMQSGRARVVVDGTNPAITDSVVTVLALVLHEIATNAAKYGALSVEEGYVDVECRKDGDAFVLQWCEHGGPPVETPQQQEGFGTVLSRLTVEGQLGGRIERDWQRDGLAIKISIPSARIQA